MGNDDGKTKRLSSRCVSTQVSAATMVSLLWVLDEWRRNVSVWPVSKYRIYKQCSHHNDDEYYDNDDVDNYIRIITVIIIIYHCQKAHSYL